MIILSCNQHPEQSSAKRWISTAGTRPFRALQSIFILIADRTLGLDILAVGILYFKLHLLDRIPTNLFPIMNKAITSTGDNYVLSLARRWLRHYIATHTGCGKDERQGFPSRLLDLGPACETVAEYCRLVEVASKLLEGYMTLSHRWGDNMPTLTAKNYQSLSSGVPWIAMPDVFRDAARVVQFLGTRYIWIDSVCIFQDNQRDVNYEVLQM